MGSNWLFDSIALLKYKKHSSLRINSQKEYTSTLETPYKLNLNRKNKKIIIK